MEWMGPTFIKIGQQLSIRADILPFEYCRELSKMQDSVPPFPTKKAIARIEELTKKKITDTFAIFRSTADRLCVDRLRVSGAAQDRREGRGEGGGDPASAGVFAADLRANGMDAGDGRGGLDRSSRHERIACAPSFR